MAGIEYKIFRVERLENIPEDIYPLDDSPLHEIDWNVDNSVDATMMLYKTCENERRQLVNISRVCSVPDEYINLTDSTYILQNVQYRLDIGNKQSIDKLGTHNLDIETWCPRLENRITAYRDVYYRDILAFKQEGFTVDIYAVVLLYQGQYQGHVYVWTPKDDINPDDYSYVILNVMGIRNSIDTIWDRDDSSLRNIALYLLEGVRLFAKHLNAIIINVIRPYNVMKLILSKLGYINREIHKIDIGNSIQASKALFIKAYTSKLFDQPYIEGSFNVTIIDDV